MDATITTNMAIGGKTLSGNVSKTSNQSGAFGPTNLPAGSTGTLSTRTDNDTGVVAAASGHGIVTSDVVNVFWSGGVHYGMTATVAGDNITVDGGAGDNLPAQDSNVVITKTVVIDVDFDGDDLVVFGMTASKRSHVQFLTAADANIYGQELPEASSWHWASGQGTTNPLAGQTVGKLRVSCGDSAAAASLDGAFLYDDVV